MNDYERLWEDLATAYLQGVLSGITLCGDLLGGCWEPSYHEGTGGKIALVVAKRINLSTESCRTVVDAAIPLEHHLMDCNEAEYIKPLAKLIAELKRKEIGL